VNEGMINLISQRI